MSTVALRAHFDGKQILLDEGYNLPPDTPLMVTVLIPQNRDEREEWASLSAQKLAAAYGDDEPEYLSVGCAAMKEGDVVLFPLPQADGRLKSRPSIVLRAMPPFGDLLVCGVSRVGGGHAFVPTRCGHWNPNPVGHIRL